jgi:hypothetical protein
MKKKLETTLLTAAVLIGTPAWSVADEGLNVRFSGFGSVSAARTSGDDFKFVTSTRQSHGVGRAWDPGLDSNLGLQANVELNSTFSAVAQVLASRREGSEEPVVEWLYGQAKVAPWLDLRVGRLVLPVFLMSDSRNVGYSSHWLRAPGDVYSQFPSSYFDGGQANAHYDIGGGNLTVQLSAGRAKAAIYTNLPAPMETVEIHMPKLRSMNIVYERGDWTVRTGRTIANSSYLYLPSVGVQVPNEDAFNGFGFQHDNGKLLVMGEFVTRRQGDHGADSDAGYLTGGYRFGPLMPYVMASRFKPKGFLYAGEPPTNSRAFGVRWDAFTNVALKAQYDRVSHWSLLKGDPAALSDKSRVHLLSLSADFVF